MSDFSTAVGWLNMFDSSHLDDTTKLLLDRFLNAVINSHDLTQSAAATEAAAKESRDPYCLPEALIVIAHSLYKARQLKPALSNLRQALTIYEKLVGDGNMNRAIHKLGVARWLYGWTAWDLYVHYTAYESWCRTRDDFKKVLEHSQDEKNGDKVRWYQETLFKMEVEFACKAEEVFTWLYISRTEDMQLHLGTTKMSETFVNRRERIVRQIIAAEAVLVHSSGSSEGDFRLVAQNVEEMLRALDNTYDLVERAEGQLECGLAFHQIRDNRQAAIQLKRAVENYQPKSHQQAVARWMLGLMQLQPGAENGNAMDSFRIAQADFILLKEQEGKANNILLSEWYAKQLPVLDAAIDRIMDAQNSLR